ncbi:hypothetical protein KKE92_03700 [Candidatus Micrarchaeota archaeon]|nr:hypothetical protein [Candidatus Micrarchaeota archaeon]
MVSCSSLRKPYTFRSKAKAFARGMPTSPLLEVAKEGFLGKHSLTSAQEQKYVERLLTHGSPGLFCGVLESDCSENIQDLFAREIQAHFQLKLRQMSSVSFAMHESSHPVDAFIDACAADAQELSKLREKTIRAVASKNITSIRAQNDLAYLFRNYPILDVLFVSKITCLPDQLDALVHTSLPPETLRIFFGQFHDSLKIPRSELALPITPYLP